MSDITSSNPRQSVSIRVAVTIAALITWGVSAYVGCPHPNPSPSVQSEQTKFDTATSDRDSRNG